MNIQKALSTLVRSTKSHSMAALLNALCFAQGPQNHRTSNALLGHECLKMLETQLRPSSLSSCNQNNLLAIFLMIFGTILIVGSAEPAANLPPFPDVNSPPKHLESTPLTDIFQEDADSPRTSQTLYDVMREHLCQMLAHYMVFIASRIGISWDKSLDKRLGFKELTGSISWAQLFLRWTLRWQDHKFDQEWLRDWTLPRKSQVEYCSLDCTPIQEPNSYCHFSRHISVWNSLRRS